MFLYYELFLKSKKYKKLIISKKMSARNYQIFKMGIENLKRMLRKRKYSLLRFSNVLSLFGVILLIPLFSVVAKNMPKLAPAGVFLTPPTPWSAMALSQEIV